MKVEQNISRLNYLLSLYKLTAEEFLSLISKGLKNALTKNDVFTENVNLSHLKRVDKFFNKGLHFYLNPAKPEIKKEASIFFRKSNFEVEPNIATRKIINHFEESKIYLSGLAKLAELDVNKKLQSYRITHSPLDVANEIRKIIYPEYTTDLKLFLTGLIGKLAENNILVYEFVETWNKKERVNVDGLFLTPNVIVLKRHQLSFRREIFTLAHELGHCLLNEEEVELVELTSVLNPDKSRVEKWCNDFAYYFLIGSDLNRFNALTYASSKNDYHHETIESISKNTHLSRIALFTRLLYESKISQNDYNKIKQEFDDKFKERQAADRKKRELEKIEGKKAQGSAPKPIKSPLLVSTIQAAYYGGLIGEYDVCKALSIKPEKIDKYIQ